MATNKRKTTTTIVAGVAAVALLLGGTFAWTSISQQAKNEAAGIVNVGGRLHDDFDGTNKDIYVENFTDPYNGGQPIYARVRLDEYMEVGKEAGGIDVDGDGNIDAVPVITDTERDNTETWKPHVPDSACAMCDSGDTCLIHDHWKWTMGGDEGSTGSTVFMPTFNKDKDSLDADVNGTYAGTNPDDKVYYDDYVVYTTDSTNGGKVNEADKEAFNGEIYSVTGTAQYDDDPDMDKNETEGQYRTETETHTAKQTATATVMTMADWIANPVPGNYWVYDEDGWAYWANPIMPGEATGLLLDGIEMFKNPGEKCYYAINVVGQFATVGDWEKFGVDEEDEDYPSEDALAVLTAASGNVPAVTVTNLDKVTLVKRGDTVKFSASTVIGATATLADNDEYDWVVLNEDFKEITTSTVKGNGDGTVTLTVGNEELNEGLYVAARSRNHGGAVGMSAVAVQHYIVNITAENNTTVLKAGRSLKLSAEVLDKGTGEAETSGVTWTVSGGNGKSKVSDDGVLTIDQDEAGLTTLTITATTKATGGFFGTYTVTVADKYALDVTADKNIADVGYTLVLNAEITKNGAEDTSAVTWSVDSTAGSTISEDGVLTVSVNEAHDAKLTVTATSVEDSEVSDTFEVTVYNGYELLKTAEAGTLETVRIDNMEWYVLKNENNRALIWAAQIVPNRSEMHFYGADGPYGPWETSEARDWLSTTFYNRLRVLKDKAMDTELYTASDYDRTDYTLTTDKIWLPSEADIFGTVGGEATSEVKEYTLGEIGIIINEGMRYSIDEEDSWLRSPWTYEGVMPQLVGSTGEVKAYRWYTKLRPAMWVDITQ